MYKLFAVIFESKLFIKTPRIIKVCIPEYQIKKNLKHHTTTKEPYH